jgi:hypothetical protein
MIPFMLLDTTLYCVIDDRFLHSFGVYNILQLPDDIHSQLYTRAIKLKYDQLTCTICDRLLIRLRLQSQIAKMYS